MEIDSPRVLYKFGKTTFLDVLDRYKVETHQTLRWRGVPLAQDYWVRVIWSHWVTKEEADKAERWFQTTYPKTFYCVTDYNGITECRDWQSNQSFEFTGVLNQKYPANEQYRTQVQNLFKQGNITLTHSKIYFVMLNKK